jgi:hypothetical protein
MPPFAALNFGGLSGGLREPDTGLVPGASTKVQVLKPGLRASEFGFSFFIRRELKATN